MGQLDVIRPAISVWAPAVSKPTPNDCLEEIGPAVYNKAIADAQSFFVDRVTDLENACYEPEMTYWAPKSP